MSDVRQRQNERLQLLLDLTTRITSNLDLREVLRAVAANIRKVESVETVDCASRQGLYNT
jgi:hypothetical protein